jgi:hypothetical protein
LLVSIIWFLYWNIGFVSSSFDSDWSIRYSQFRLQLFNKKNKGESCDNQVFNWDGLKKENNLKLEDL